MFLVGTPSIDWLTVTTLDVAAAMALRDRMSEGARLLPERQRMQYRGATAVSARGTVFLGAYDGAGGAHWLCQASGLCADDVYSWLGPAIARRVSPWKVTRLDIQLTVDYDPGEWKQRELFYRLNRRGTVCTDFVESWSGNQTYKLATVYYGKRGSDRVVRIYEKEGLGEDRYLRFEVEFKAERARYAARVLGSGIGPSKGAILKAEIERVADAPLSDAFLPPLNGEKAAHVRAIKTPDDGSAWIMSTCMPKLTKYMAEYGSMNEVGDALLVIAEAVLAGSFDNGGDTP